MLNLTGRDWRFCLRWTLVNAIALGFSRSLEVNGFMTGPIILGIAQGLTLVGYWNRSVHWAIATVLGGYATLAAFLITFFVSFSNIDLSLPLLAAVSSIPLGLAQAFVLLGNSQFWF
ncbi:MAG: hypothetical protein F6K42_33075 [Leptolyngbya sp. SIO1D8]|nr:hypothetical protein [Leptolyngbya sp. SIO1D8]